MKKKSGLIVIIVLLLVVLLAGGAFAYVYLATDLLRTDKEIFFKYFSQIFTEGQFIDSSIQQYNEKKQQTPYENSGGITVNANIPEEFGIQVDNVNELAIGFSGKTDKLRNVAEQRVEIDYGNDVIFPITYRQYEDSFGLQFDHFGSKYIAVRNENLKELAEKFGVEDTSEIPDKIELSEVNEEINFSEEEIEQLKQIYGAVLQEELLEENFSNIKVVDGQSYTLQLSGEQIKNIIIKMLETTKQNTLLIDKVNEYMAKIDENSEKLDVESIEELIESINEEDSSEIPNLKITLTQKNKKLNQIVIESGDNRITITKTSEEDKLGYQTNIEIKSVEEESTSEINAFFNVQYNGIQTLNNVGESFDIGFEIANEDVNMAYEYNIINAVQFKESVSIEEFDESGAVFLNDHEADIVTNFMAQVVTRLSEINKNQMEELGLQEDENPLIYSTPITMLGMVVYNMSSDAVEEAELQDYETQQFNDKFESYVGEDVSGTDVNAMIKTVFNHNIAQTDETATVKVTDGEGNVIVEATNQFSDDPEKVSSTNKYKIEAIYNDEKLITEIVISTQD